MSCSAVNSCPVSPESSFRHRVPSFDLKAMAKYASKLLSTQEQAGSDNEVGWAMPILCVCALYIPVQCRGNIFRDFVVYSLCMKFSLWLL